jgi:hypothetical protein
LRLRADSAALCARPLPGTLAAAERRHKVRVGLGAKVEIAAAQVRHLGLHTLCRRRETHCEFCGDVLPDWKAVLTPACGVDAPAIMSVAFGSNSFSFTVQPGLAVSAPCV